MCKLDDICKVQNNTIMKKITLSIIIVVSLFLISSCGKNTENQINKMYEFEKIEVVFKDNPTDTITFYNANFSEKENVFFLKNNANIAISNLNWYETYKNKEYEKLIEWIRSLILYILYLCVGMLIITIIRIIKKWKNEMKIIGKQK